MTTQEVKSKFYEAISQNQNGQLSADDTEKVVRHLYGVVREISDATPSYEQCGDMAPKSKAHLDRFEMHQTLRQFDIDVEY